LKSNVIDSFSNTLRDNSVFFQIFSMTGGGALVHEMWQTGIDGVLLDRQVVQFVRKHYGQGDEHNEEAEEELEMVDTDESLLLRPLDS
jgi:hypothetical protein